MARTTLSFYTICFILALTGSALPAKRADPASPSSEVAPSGMAHIAYDAVKVSYTLNTPDGTVIDRTQSTTHVAQEINKDFYDGDDDETPKPTPVNIRPVPTPSSSGTATKSLKGLDKAQSAERVHGSEEPSSSPSPSSETKTDTEPEEPEEPEEETPTEDQKQSEPSPTPTPTKKQSGSSSATPATPSPSAKEDDPIKSLPFIGHLLGIL
ncbi:hypothetical protein ANOM_007825 [Aspergillus nomiae NRRL 13137]|uniref:GPI anchored protein n=1 Tax=Aspergillus nomiae NRRL (strain ATCC 15546 / NRRL 13137 / CBS 260.88 / M93) TaxID=1509407 RepID=A0A0L1IVG3_ASPN3|nr:uncharacterized protein ANOM_007825 [Aspergillus nomiae NRRL 13137]KNG83469.1 hypothetical protein ANOM_007825 [Aspergillus nomiae NRRL 13137]